MKAIYTLLVIFTLGSYSFAQEKTPTPPATSVPVVKQPSWYQVREEVAAKLIANKKDLFRWANELADQKPKDAWAAMVKIEVMLRAGLDRHAARAIGEFKKFCRDTDRSMLRMSLHDFYRQAVAQKAWHTALAVVETFPKRIDSQFKIEEKLVEHLKQDGWSDEQLGRWLDKMQQRVVKEALPPEHWEGCYPPVLRPKIYWQKLLIDHQKEPNQKAAFLVPFEKAVREDQTDFRRILDYLNICSFVKPDQAWVFDIDLFQPQRSTDACRVAKKLQELGQWTSAAKLYRYAIDTPLQKNESTHRCTPLCQAVLSSSRQSKRYQTHIRRGLGNCLIKLGKKEEDQKWLTEATTRYTDRSRLQLPPHWAGKDKQKASINEVEQRILAEEVRSKGKGDYWNERARFYGQWQRLDPKVDKKAEIEHAYQQGLDVAKPKPRLRGKAPWSTRKALFSGYLHFLESNKRYDDAFSLLTHEIQTAPAESWSTEAAIYRLNSLRYRDRLGPDDPILWKWLGERKDWDYLEFNLLEKLAQKIKTTDIDRQPKLYRKFVDRIEKFAVDKNPTHAIGCAKIVIDSSRLGIPAKPEDAIPWLEGVQMRNLLKNSSTHQTNKEKYQIKTVNALLFKAYLATGKLKEAEKLIGSDDRFTDRNHFRQLAIQAAKQGNEDVAMKAWHRVANVSLYDNVSQTLKKQLRGLGLSDQLDAYYRDVKEKLPKFDDPKTD